MVDVVLILKDTINRRWTVEQRADYDSFLDHLFIFTDEYLFERLYTHEDF